MSLKSALSFESNFLLSYIFMMYNSFGNCTLECDLKTVLQSGPKSNVGSKPTPSLASSVTAVNRHAKNDANG